MRFIKLYYYTYVKSRCIINNVDDYSLGGIIFMKIKSFKLYFSLFRITFNISAFTFGGGYIVIPMMRKYFVNDLKLISERELLDMAAIAQSTPGAIAVNIAVLVGYRISGITGAVIKADGIKCTKRIKQKDH